MKTNIHNPSGLRPVPGRKTATRAVSLAFLTLPALAALLVASSESSSAATTYHDFSTDPDIAGSWTNSAYFTNTGTATWNPVDQDLDLVATTGDRWSILRPTVATRGATDPVSMDLTALDATTGSWSVVGLTVFQNATGTLLSDTSPKYMFFLEYGAAGWFYRIRRDGTNNLFTSSIINLDLSSPLTLSIERNADNYDFKANGSTIYTGSYYSSAVHDGMANYHLTWGSGGTSSMTATVDNFGVIPEPSAALLGGIGCLLLLRRRSR